MIPLAYIASPSYSGSTLLTFLMNAHPDLGTIGELKWGTIDLISYECSCGELLRECPFWAQVAGRVEAKRLPFDLARPLTDFRVRESEVFDRVARARVRGPLFESVRNGLLATIPQARRAWPLITAVNRTAIEAIMELQGARMFLDSSKEPVRVRHLMRTGDYDVRIIQLMRDGRGVVNSALKHGDVTAKHAAEEWVRTHRQVERLSRILRADRWLTLRYEDLCNDPAVALRRVFVFLGLAPCKTDNYRATTHHILGNSMRLRSSEEIRLDESWRQTLSAADLDVFEKIGGPLNRGYGYV